MEFNLGFATLESFLKRKDGSIQKINYAFIAAGQYGGRQGDELARLGYHVSALNTSDEDLKDLKIITKENTIKLKGYNGAVKDINRGQSAIKDNKDIIINLLKRPEIINADHVFVIGGTGGGTGNAALPILLTNLAKVRKPFNGKPSFGAILSVPGSWEARGIKKNAAWGLSHIKELVEAKATGANIIVDNEKLYKLHEDIFSSVEKEIDWRDYGNTTLAALIAEISFLTSLPSSKTFDSDELRDVLSTPGYLALGKIEIDSDLNEKEIPELITNSFTTSPLASDFDYELDSENGFVTIIHPSKNEKNHINESLFKSIEEKYSKFISNAEKPHSGLIINSEWGKIRGKSKLTSTEHPKAIMYCGAVLNRLPHRIKEMLSEIKTEEEELEKKRSERENDELDLTAFKDVKKEVAVASQKVIKAEFDLFSDNETKTEKANDDWEFDI